MVTTSVDATVNEPSTAWAIRNARGLFLALIGALVIGLLVVTALDVHTRSQVPGGLFMALQDAHDAATLERAVCALAAPGPACPVPPGALDEPLPSILPLRAMLLVDSVLIVLPYTALLLLATWVAASRRLAVQPGIRWLVHAGCLVVVAAGMFGMAQNGMTIRAAEDALIGLLADPTIADIERARVIKWTLLALSVGQIAGWGWLGRPARQGEQRG